MALSDCPKCWDTPCTCGHMYAQWPRASVVHLKEVLEKVLDGRYQRQVVDLAAAQKKIREESGQ